MDLTDKLTTQGLFMNKSKQPISKRIQKKVLKTLKKDLQSGEDTLLTPLSRQFPSPNELLAHLPSKQAKMKKDHMLSMEKSIQHKKAKALTKHSKRTTPSDGIENSSPAHPHIEGSRWKKTLSKQTKAENKITSRRSMKIK